MFGLPIFRTGTRKPPTEREDILERFALQGEGGYSWNTFNFVDKDKMYVTRGFADSRYSSVIGGEPSNPAAYYTTYRYTTAIGGTTYYGLSGILRFCAGNSNNTAIFRDGRVFWSKNTKVHPWVRDNINQFKDLFMPSSYRANYVQLVLMQNGELRKLDLDYAAEENNPPIIVGTDNTSSPTTYKTLNDVTRIVAINQAHNADCIVACKDDSVWHVAIATTNFTPSGEYDARRIKNLKASEIQFAMIGDPGDSCFVVLKSEPRNLYRLTNSGRNLCDFAWLTERSLTPVNLSPFTYYGSSSTTLLESDEQFIDGSSNEFHYTFLTNKHVHCFKAAQYGIGGCAYPGRAPVYVKHTLLPCQQPPVRMVTATSYAMAVELADGFYLLSSNGIANYDTGGNDGEYYKAYQKMERIENWTKLAKVLAPLRGAATFDKDCTPPPPETYALTRSVASVNEGNSVTFTLNTTNVPNGRTVPYVITGTGITTADIGGVPLTGDFTINNNTASVTLNIAADLLTEGTETLTLTAEGRLASVTINDISTTPPTYTLTSSVASVNEGGSVTFTMTTTDVSNGTLVPYKITGVSSADIGGVSLTGNFIINNNTASVTLNITADATTEGAELLTMNTNGQYGQYANVQINDTSKTPALNCYTPNQNWNIVSNVRVCPGVTVTVGNVNIAAGAGLWVSGRLNAGTISGGGTLYGDGTLAVGAINCNLSPGAPNGGTWPCAQVC